MIKLILLIPILLTTVTLYYDLNTSLGVLIGMIWGIANFYFIHQLIHHALINFSDNFLKVIGLSLLKFPLLYFSGYYLLQSQWFSPWILLSGFTITLALAPLFYFYSNYYRSNVIEIKKNEESLEKVRPTK